MIKYLKLLLLGLPVFLGSCSNCSKESVSPTDTAGKGGNATLHITPRHHDKQIDSCTIYVKYNAVDTPANGVFDDSAKCMQVAGVPIATFSGLRKGKYYLFGYGWDPSLTPAQHVRGGYAYSLTTETDQNIELAVSED